MKLIKFKVVQNNQNVSIITRMPHKTQHSLSREYFSSTFTSIVRNETYNVVTAFANEIEASHYMKNHLTNDVINNQDYEYSIKQYEIEELKYIGFLLKMPILVYINSYCDRSSKYEVNEVFYKSCDKYDYKF